MENIIITGKRSSGKTLKSKEFISKFKKYEVRFFDGDDNFINNKCNFSNCNEETKLIVIDNIMDIDAFGFA